MKLSAPIYQLKRRAKTLSRDQQLPLNEALNRIAVEEGYNSWSLLAVKASNSNPSKELYEQLSPGDLVLLGARPGHGKTQLGLKLLFEAINQRQHAAFFTLEYNEVDVLRQFKKMGGNQGIFDHLFNNHLFDFDNSNGINADYIIEKLRSVPIGTIVVIDYLQLLDQKRQNPDLTTQVQALKIFASKRGLIIVFLSQIDRSYDLTTKTFPDLEDIRLPNPLDLKLFNKACFLNEGNIQIETLS